MQRFPEETGDLGDRLLGGGGRRQRKQSGPVRIDGKLGMRGETGKELGKRKGQTSGFVRQLRETRSRGRLPAQRETKGRKSAGAGKKIFSFVSTVSSFHLSVSLFAYALHAPLSNLFRRFAFEQRLGTHAYENFLLPLRILFPTFRPLRLVCLSVLSSYIFTIFAVFSESFEVERSCNRVHRTLDSFS